MSYLGKRLLIVIEDEIGFYEKDHRIEDGAVSAVHARVMIEIGNACDTPQHHALLQLIDANHRANQLICKQADEMKELQHQIDLITDGLVKWQKLANKRLQECDELRAAIT